VYNFAGPNDGACPGAGGLIRDKADNLYGERIAKMCMVHRPLRQRIKAAGSAMTRQE